MGLTEEEVGVDVLAEYRLLDLEDRGEVRSCAGRAVIVKTSLSMSAVERASLLQCPALAKRG